MRQVGMFLMPHINETHVQQKIQQILNSTKIVNPQNHAAMVRIFDKLHLFAETRLSQLLLVVMCIPMALTIVENIALVKKKSKHSFRHQMSGLIPLVLIAAGMASCFSYS